MNPLHRAAIDGDLSLIDRLLAEGSNPRAIDDHGATPLILAASHGRAAAVERLLPLSDPEARDNQADWTALDHALGAARLDVVRVLAPHADLRALDSEGRTPLMRAAKFLGPEAVEALLPFSNPLQVNDRGQIALHMAVMRNSADSGFPRALVTPEAVNVRDNGGGTPLFLACMAGNAPAVQALLDCPQCDPLLFDRDNRSALGAAADFVGVEMLAPFARRLGPDLPLAAGGDNPLAIAAALPGNLEGVRFLSSFFDASFFPEALRAAAFVGEPRVIDFLLPFCPDANAADPQGNTALMMAAANGQMEAIGRLLPVSDINLQNKTGHSALHLAIGREQHAATALLAPLSDLSQLTGEGESLMRFALFNKNGPSPFDSEPSWGSVLALFPHASIADQAIALEKSPYPETLGKALADHEERVLRAVLSEQAQQAPLGAAADIDGQPPVASARKTRSL